MNKAETQPNWAEFIKLFSRQNRSRPTRIGVFEGAPGSMTDYWLEDGLPLEGIDIDSKGSNAPIVEIMLGSPGKAGSRAFTHKIEKTRFAKIVLSVSGESDGLDIENDEGAITILRFENER